MNMKPTLALLRFDAKQAFRDPLLALALLGPAGLLLLLRFGWPAAEQWLSLRYGFDLAPHAPFALAFAMQLVPQLLGVMAGFVLLEERDTRLIASFAATPLGRGGYIRYRMAAPFLIACFWTAAIVYGSGMTPPDPAYALPAAAFTAVLAPVYALVPAAYADNKVEGLALAKLTGLFVIGPIAAAFAPMPWALAAAPLPTFWPAVLVLDGMGSAAAGLRAAWLPTACGAAAAAAAWFYILYHAYRRKAE